MINKVLNQSPNQSCLLNTSYSPIHRSTQQLQCKELIVDYLSNKQQPKHVRGLLKYLE